MRSKIAIPLFGLVLSGCVNAQSALQPHGPSAAILKDLIVWIVAICTLVWLAVVIALGLALMRRRPDGGKPAERRVTRVVVASVALTALIITGFTIASFYATRGLGSGEGAGVTIRAEGRQWWWRFTYVDRDPARSVATANEIHIPVGRAVRLELISADVIHSFWVPSLAGKQDMIPGRENVLTLMADKPGIYRGQCAEFCGLQHSHMALLVIAESEEDFRRWLDGQRAPAREPVEDEARAGRDVFLARQCAACHTVRGTSASGGTGPDLTHVGGRRSIAAGLLETSRGSLAAWIADPQTLKPGNNMPLVPLSSDELRQVSAYMESLK